LNLPDVHQDWTHLLVALHCGDSERRVAAVDDRTHLRIPRSPAGGAKIHLTFIGPLVFVTRNLERAKAWRARAPNEWRRAPDGARVAMSNENHGAGAVGPAPAMARFAELCKDDAAFHAADAGEVKELLGQLREIVLNGVAPKERKTRALPFTKDNIKRRIDAVREAGLDVAGVTSDGTVLTETRRDKASGLTGKPKLRDAREMLDA
jgi:hypothetical protein